MSLYWENNLSLLLEKDKSQYRLIKEHRISNKCSVVPTSSAPTLRVHGQGNQFVSVYDTQDALKGISTQLSQMIKTNPSETICIFTGIGLGYHPLILAAEQKSIFRIVIIEPCLDIFYLAMQHVDLSILLKSEKVKIFLGDVDWNEFASVINFGIRQLDYQFIDATPLFSWQPDMYQPVKEKVSAISRDIKSAAEGAFVFGRQFFENRISNLTLLRQSSHPDELIDLFKNKPALLISAGPSLGTDIDLIKNAVGKCVIISVDSALHPLLKLGITPDIVTTLDFRPLNSEKLSPDVIRTADFTLAAVITSSPLSPKRLPLNNLVFCYQENDTQGWISKALKIKQQFPTMRNVSAFSLSLAQKMGANPIILVGHDYALTSQENDHVRGTVFSFNWQNSPDCIRTKGVKGLEVKTLDFLVGFKKELEAVIIQRPRTYINATSSGLHIEGTTEQSLESVIEEYMTKEINTKSILKKNTSTLSDQILSEVIESAKNEVNRAHKKRLDIQKISKLNNKYKSMLESNKNKIRHLSHVDSLPQNIQKHRQKRNRLMASYRPFLAIEELVVQDYAKIGKTNVLETENNYFESLLNEAFIIDSKMKAQTQGLKIFINEVNELISYLHHEHQMEDKIKKDACTEKDLIQIGKRNISQLNTIKAKRYLKKCISKYPDSVEAMILMGEAQANQLEFDLAFQCWDTAMSLKPEVKGIILEKRISLAEYWCQRAKEEVFNAENYLKRALKFCSIEELCTIDKKPFWSQQKEKAYQYLEDKNDTDAAESLLTTWSSLKEEIPEWYFLYAKIFYQRDALKSAQYYVQKAIEKQPDNAGWLAFHARILLETNQFDQGLVCLEQAVLLDPCQAELWEELGDTLFAMDDFSSAAVAYEKCFLALPKKTDVLRKFGDCFFKEQQFEAAKAAYLEVLKTDAANREAKERLRIIESKNIL